MPQPSRQLLDDEFREDDFVVVKLDIDTHYIERPMAGLLLSEENRRLTDLVDVFYFEHHHLLREMVGFWTGSATGGATTSSTASI